MYSRILDVPNNQSVLLLGPRGTGKSFWLKQKLSKSLTFDLLDDRHFTVFTAHPEKLESLIPSNYSLPIVIDEIQRVPLLLNEVHRLIENKGYTFILTGSSARKLRREGTNLLAGRAFLKPFFPLVVDEIQEEFDLKKSLNVGHLPMAYRAKDPKAYLQSYVSVYLKEEIQQEGLTRSLPAFSRFLEVASFSQGSVLNISSIAREAHINRKVAEAYFQILEDTFLSIELPAFTKKAKRELVVKSKFYFFDVGIYRTIRPLGPLDSPEGISGTALESLVIQEFSALNQLYDWEFKLYFWQTKSKVEVDLVLYGQQGFYAIEIKQSHKVKPDFLKGLQKFKKDYPGSKAILLYGGEKSWIEHDILILPLKDFFKPKGYELILNF